jgi:hypothetical protein
VSDETVYLTFLGIFAAHRSFSRSFLKIASSAAQGCSRIVRTFGNFKRSQGPALTRNTVKETIPVFDQHQFSYCRQGG